MDIIELLVILILIISICCTLYKKKYSSAAGIGIMLVVYLLIKNKVGIV